LPLSLTRSFRCRSCVHASASHSSFSKGQWRINVAAVKRWLNCKGILEIWKSQGTRLCLRHSYSTETTVCAGSPVGAPNWLRGSSVTPAEDRSHEEVARRRARHLVMQHCDNARTRAKRPFRIAAWNLGKTDGRSGLTKQQQGGEIDGRENRHRQHREATKIGHAMARGLGHRAHHGIVSGCGAPINENFTKVKCPRH